MPRKKVPVEWHRKYRAEHFEQCNIARIKYRFKVTREEATKLHEKVMFGHCDVCKGRDAFRRLAIDHNHTTNRVRGVLCNSCNWALGHVEDNANLLRKLAEYLDASSQ